MFWGIGRDGQGRNELGKALMRLRGRLRECARCSRLQPPSVPIKRPEQEEEEEEEDINPRSSEEPAPDAKSAKPGMYSTIYCTDGVLMSLTISNPIRVVILTLASARSGTCHSMQTSYMHYLYV
jgi:hypothetical protein